MTPRRLAPLAALAASLALALPRPGLAAAPDREAVQASERELAAGLADYGKADYASAIEHFERAYALHPSPQYLYAWAQAARSAGDCATAVELYRRFIDAGATGASREAAEQNAARCRDELAAEAQAAEAEAAPEPELPPPEPEPVDDAPIEPTPGRPRPDALGLALVVTGGVALGAGAALLAVAGVRRGTQAEATDYDRFDALDRQILRLDVAGGATLGVGAVLAVVGAIRLTLQSRRGRDTTSQARLARQGDRPLRASSLARDRGRDRPMPRPLVLPTLDARGTPMLLFRIALP